MSHEAPQHVPTIEDDRGVAKDRAQFLTGARRALASVRSPILASWERSQEHGVAADRVAAPLLDDQDLNTPFVRSATPVLRALTVALAGQPVSIVLTNHHGLVLTRHSGDDALARKLDRVNLAPGFVYSEEFVGTNGIGTAIEMGGPTEVVGHEHFAEHLEDLACAGAPIHHPLTGRTMGIIDLTCRRKDAGSLLLTLALTTAAQIQTALLEETSPGTRMLVDAYLRACHRSATMVLAVGSGLGMLNDRARALLQPDDQAALMLYAGESLTELRQGRRDVELPSGRTGRLTCELVHDGTRALGVVVRARLLSATPARSATAPERPGTASLPGLVGRAPVWSHTCREAERLFLADVWMAVAGEPGTGKLALLRAIQLRRQPVPRSLVLDCRSGNQPDWLEQLRTALRRPGSTLVVAHVDELDRSMLRRVVMLLQEAATSEEAPWVAVTMSDRPPSPEIRDLLALFPTTLGVPPLRVRPEDVALLVTHFLSRLSGSSPPQCSSEAVAMLTRASWPGNVQQLLDVVGQVLIRKRSGRIEALDLPPVAHSVSRRRLSLMESMARDAIVRALADSDGDKSAAAAALGMSRATIYRKIKSYEIVEPPSRVLDED